MAKSNYMLRIRLDKGQEERLRNLAKAEGCKTLSEFCRQKLFQSLSTEIKLNNILKLLEEKNDR